jgi:hypothetical protein
MMVEDGNFKIHSFYESMPMSGGYGLQHEVSSYRRMRSCLFISVLMTVRWSLTNPLK